MAHRTLLIILSITILVGTVVYMNERSRDVTQSEHGDTTSQASVLLSGETFFVDVMRTRESQAKGLSGRPSLEKHQGMLFWFTRDDFYPFWMPDMNFDIDILWIDKDWTVVHIEEEVSRESYPASFSSPTLARYVLELSAGTVKEIGAKVGQKITLDLKAP